MTDTEASTKEQLFDSDTLLEFARDLFVATGMSTDHATRLAENLVDADLHGVNTHGVVRIPGYVDQLLRGDVDPKADVRLEDRSVASALVDGGGTFGAIAGSMAMEWGIAAARTTGIAMIGAKNVAHFGAAGYFSRLASQAGMIGIAMTNTPPAVATTGGVDGRLGNNPLAIAAPGPDDFCLDIAMSVVSRGRVKLTSDAGLPIPDGWAIDAEGNPTNDGPAALDGSLLPFGGYKGAGLALAVEILAAALTGAQLTQQAKPSGLTATAGQGGRPSSGGSVTIGHLFLVIDPQIFRPLDEVEQDIHQIVDYVKSSKTIPGQSVTIAGQREAALSRSRLAEGVPLSPGVVSSLNAVAASLSLPALVPLA